MQEILYFYDGSFEGFLSCVFESYAKRERPSGIESEEIPTLFPTRWVETDAAHAQRVLRKLHAVSPWGLELLRKLHAVSPGGWSWSAGAFSPACPSGRWPFTGSSKNYWRKAPPSSIISPMRH